jgi:NAD(P)H-dependent flavin oxidoreductase YrpB (nitropropane dioxygenase family)
LTGDVEATALYAGQSVGLVREVLPAAEIVARLVEEAEAALRSASGLVD